MHLDKIELTSPDLTATKAFYQDLLGFAVVEASETRLSIAAGSSVLTFLKTDAPAFYHFAFLIPGNQVDAALHWVGERTVILPFDAQRTIADFKNWNAHAFYFHDNNQNILEFIAHHDLQNDSEKPFSAASIISICEIGIPVPSVPEACRRFKEQHGVPYYVKGPHLPDFAVMGDEEGLLIITTIGRGWLPTQRPAERHFLQLTFSHNNKKTSLRNKDLPQ
jgi:catechol 2,3-dioxygenase-like lactoylglutathione lyase family enzyme